MNVAGAAPPGEDGLGGVRGAAIGEIAQEGIAGAQRQKTEGMRSGPRRRSAAGKQAVDDFVGCAVAAHGDEIALPRA